MSENCFFKPHRGFFFPKKKTPRYAWNIHLYYSVYIIIFIPLPTHHANGIGGGKPFVLHWYEYQYINPPRLNLCSWSNFFTMAILKSDKSVMRNQESFSASQIFVRTLCWQCIPFLSMWKPCWFLNCPAQLVQTPSAFTSARLETFGPRLHCEFPGKRIGIWGWKERAFANVLRQPHRPLQKMLWQFSSIFLRTKRFWDTSLKMMPLSKPSSPK